MENEKDPKQELLIEKLSDSRLKLETYESELVEMKDSVKNIFPTEINFRNRFILDEKLKTMSEFFSSLLRLRQEINKTIISESELRRKNNITGDDEKSKYTDDDVRTIMLELDNKKRYEAKDPNEDEQEQTLKIVK